MVFVGNINQSVDVLMKTSHLFEPFPAAMTYDGAFFDRMHYYLPGWEIPKMRPEYFTNEYGFITDYIAEFFREMRKRPFGDAIERYLLEDLRPTLAELKRQGNNLNQIARYLHEGTEFGEAARRVMNECWKAYRALLSLSEVK